METEMLEALQLIRQMLATDVNPDRILCGNAKTYYPIMLDGKPRQTICRLYFKHNRFVGIISTRKVETRTRIDTNQELYRFSGEMATVLKKYMG